MAVDDSNDIISFFWIDDFYKSRFKCFRFIDVKVRAGFKIEFFINIEKNTTFRCL